MTNDEEKEKKEIELDGKTYPYFGIGYDELTEDGRKEIQEILARNPERTMSQEDGLKILSLALSRGKRNDGQTRKCACGTTYIVFPDEEKDCVKCGKKLVKIPDENLCSHNNDKNDCKLKLEDEDYCGYYANVERFGADGIPDF